LSGVGVLLAAGTINDELQAKFEAKFGGYYEWKPSDDPTFFEGRQANIYARGAEVGQFGIIHPEVLEAFDIPFPVSALELNLEPFLFDQFYNAIPTHLAMPK
jgi:phenylalanyl-tRNA synthetase beta subunit